LNDYPQNAMQNAKKAKQKTIPVEQPMASSGMFNAININAPAKKRA